MNPTQGSGPGESSSSKNIVVLSVILLLILIIVIFLVYIFKPESGSPLSEYNETEVTAKENSGSESIGPLILEVSNLSGQIRMMEDISYELIYNDPPDTEKIKQFVSNFKDWSAVYSVNGADINESSGLSHDNDSSIISSDLQQKLLGKSISDIMSSIEKMKRFFNSVPVSLPIAKELAQVVSGFGMREHPIIGEPRMHTGIDIKAPVGTAVVAAASGKIVRTEEQIGYGYGQPCMIEHKFGYQTLYGHLVRLEVHNNQIVKKGDVIGRVGDTGLSQGPHLHFEIRKNGKPLNPSYFLFEGLTINEYNEIISRGTQ